jgi:predicted RNA-binding protein YlxR (DUF448 family)
MSEPNMHMNVEATAEAPAAHRGRTRTCVGCGERVDVLAVSGPDDLVRLILGPNGEIAVDARGGGFGRGAHVHARRSCLERAARSGLLRATKGNARRVLFSEAGVGEVGEAGVGDHPAGRPGASVDRSEALSTDSLARAIQSAMDRRIEGLLRAAVRSRHMARGSDAVTGACRRSEGELVVVACDAAAAANLTEVRRAVAEGRAVAWGTKERLGAIVAPAPAPHAPGPVDAAGSCWPAPSHDGGDPHTPGPAGAEGVGVVSISSRSIAGALRQAVRAADAVTSSAGAAVTSQEGALPKGAASAGDGRRRSRGGTGARRARGSSQ